MMDPPHLNEISPKLFLYPMRVIHGQPPFFAGTPPTTRLWGTFDIPHPSEGKSRRSGLDVSGASGLGVTISTGAAVVDGVVGCVGGLASSSVQQTACDA